VTPEELTEKYPLPEGVTWLKVGVAHVPCIAGQLPGDPHRDWRYAWIMPDCSVYAADPRPGGHSGKFRHKAATQQEGIDSAYTYFILGDWRNEIR